MEITARAIFDIPYKDVWNLEDRVYRVQYEDGSIVPTHLQGIILNRYCWELLKHYPQTPITAACDVLTMLGDGDFNFGTHTRLLRNIFVHICEVNGIRKYEVKEKMLRTAYVIVNEIFNDIVLGASRYVAKIDAVDFVGVVKDPVISEIQEALQATTDSVENAYRAIRGYMNDKSLDNCLVKAYRAKAINENQANQCIGPRGFVTDLDRTVFTTPIKNGFIRGMGSLYELMTESRTAAKSLNATEDHIRTSEYASRRIQLLTMSVTGIATEDCGSTDYLKLHVTERRLPNMRGIWYKLKEEDELKECKGNERELVDRVVLIRSAFGCRTPDPHRICTRCLGSISENIKENSNLGYVMTAYLMEKLTQAILSTKHLTNSVRKALIQLQGAVLKYFHARENNCIYLNPKQDLSKLQLVLPSNQLPKLADVMSLDHTNVVLDKIGELETVAIISERNGVQFKETVNIAYRDRLSSITKAMLDYLKVTECAIDNRGNYVVPLANWDISKPLFINQLKETNIVSFVNRFASLIEVTRNNRLTLEEHFQLVMDTVHDQFPCNLTVLMVVVYATTTYNAEGGNYRLGRNSPNARQENNTLLFRNRSISQMLVYESQIKEIIKHAPIIFSNNYRSDHPLDVLFTPQNVVK